jgi:homoserine dehydrogenase
MIRILLVGFGHVGRRLVEILADRSLYPGLAGLDVSIVGITTGRHGSLIRPQGIDLPAALSDWRSAGHFPGATDLVSTMDSLQAIRSLDYDTLVELSTLSVATRGEPAITHVREALARGKHVITCNKGPVAWAYRPLRDLAATQEVSFLYEGTVMDGAPIFNLAYRCLAGNTISRIEGILNSTTNVILAAMENGLSLEQGLALAQQEGVAEADARLDLDGWDAAVKLSALANAMMDGELLPEEVERQSLFSLSPGQVHAAQERGCRLKMVCRVEHTDSGLHASVKATEVSLSDPLALVGNRGSMIRISTDLLGQFTLAQENPNLTSTAYAVIGDLFSLAGRSENGRSRIDPGG